MPSLRWQATRKAQRCEALTRSPYRTSFLQPNSNRVREHVASGLYGSASGVIREALRLFEAYQSVQAANLSSLKSDIAAGLADADAGQVHTFFKPSFVWRPCKSVDMQRRPRTERQRLSWHFQRSFRTVAAFEASGLKALNHVVIAWNEGQSCCLRCPQPSQ